MTLCTPCARKPAQAPCGLQRGPIRGPGGDIGGTRVNARAAEFVAKPGRTEELRDHIFKAVTPLLRERSGFIRTIVLTSDEEPRRVVAITFWSSEGQICTTWEEPLVREILSPLVDVWPKDRTYKAELTETTKTDEQVMSQCVC